MLRQGVMTLFRKPSNREDSRLMSQRTIFLELESPKRGGYGLVVADFLVSESFVLAALPIGQITMFL